MCVCVCVCVHLHTFSHAYLTADKRDARPSCAAKGQRRKTHSETEIGATNTRADAETSKIKETIEAENSQAAKRPQVDAAEEESEQIDTNVVEADPHMNLDMRDGE